MKANVIIALVAVFSSAVLFAQENNSRRGKIREAVLKKYDANGNGELDENERAIVLKTFDANGNGVLDRDEKLALAIC